MNLQLSDHNLHFKCARTHTGAHTCSWCLAAAAGGAAFHAAVAAAVAGHDGAAGAATGAVAHLVHGLHRRGRVEDAAVDRVERVGGRPCAGGVGGQAAGGGEVSGDQRLRLAGDALSWWGAVITLEGLAVELVEGGG